jgi:cytoskeletal protein CcmA (bactofilin family)
MRMGRLSIKGDLAASEDVIVDFALDGTIDITGHRLAIMEGASVQALVTAASVEVRGRLDGHISAERVELASTAVVTASVVAPKIVLHDGAQLTGPVNTDRAQAAGSVARHRQKASSGASTAV